MSHLKHDTEAQGEPGGRCPTENLKQSMMLRNTSEENACSSLKCFLAKLVKGLKLMYGYLDSGHRRRSQSQSQEMN